MNVYLGVEIEHRHYAQLLPLRKHKAEQGKLLLTTIADRQKRAIVRTFILSEKGRHLLKEFEVRNIPSSQAGDPHIDIHAKYDGKRTVNLLLRLNGRQYTRETVDIGKFLPRSFGWVWILAAVLLLTLLSLLWFCGPLRKSDTVSADSARPESTFTRQIPSEDEESTERAVDTTTSPEAGSQTKSSTAQGSAPDPDRLQAAPESTVSPSEEATPEEPPSQADRTAESESAAATAPAAKPITPAEQETFATGPHLVYFRPDSTALTDSARTALRELSTELPSDHEVIVRGHCALFGSEEGRIEISELRAENVFAYLKEAGWDPVRRVTVEGVAGRDPVTRDRTRQDLNRRVEIIVR